MKRIINILLWPVLFILGQTFIRYPFISHFNKVEFDKLSKIYPKLQESALKEKMLEYVNTNDYIDKLNNYINNHALLIMIITFIIFGIIFYVLYKPYKKYTLKELNYFKLIFVGISISIIYNTLIYYLGVSNNYFISEIPLYVLILTVGIMGPILEELLFRGIVYNRCKNYFNYKNSIIIASVIFGLFHLPNIVNFVYATILSFVLIYSYNKNENIKAPIIIHISANITTQVYLYLLLSNNILLCSLILIVCSILLGYIISKKK